MRRESHRYAVLAVAVLGAGMRPVVDVHDPGAAGGFTERPIRRHRQPPHG